MAHDKHVRAYDVLLTERSRIIERNYRSVARIEDAKPELDAACLYCHSLDAKEAQRGLTVANSRTASAVNVVTGRPPSGLANTIRTPGKRSPRGKSGEGLHDLKDLVKRGRVCVDCHIGSGRQRRQPRHDRRRSSAAQLRFRLLRRDDAPHWDVAREKQENPTWKPGLGRRPARIGGAIAQLLPPRADASTEPWPEFAEYDCFACHHDLQADSPRQRAVLAAFPARCRGAPGTLRCCLGPRLSFRAIERHWSHCKGNAETVSRPCKGDYGGSQPGCNWASRQAAAGKRYDFAQLRRTFSAIARDDGKTLDATWDGAAQSYLALAALHHAMTDLDPSWRNAEIRAALVGMSGQLRFPRGYDSPRRYRPTEFERWLQPLQNLEAR